MRHLLLTLALISCGSSTPITPPPPPPPPPPGSVSILMLGNSLTYTNDVPGLVAELAARGGAIRPTVTSIALANFGLEDHWNYGPSLAALDSDAFDYLILQQGPSTLITSGQNLMDYSGRIADRVAKYGYRVGMYVVWPPIGGDIDAGILHYTEAANAKGMAIYPVAHAFRALAASHPEIVLYQNDNFHPNHAGSWLAAMIIAGTIFEQDPTTYPNLVERFMPAEWADPLRAAAKAAIDTYGKR